MEAFGLFGEDPANWWKTFLHPVTPAQVGDYTPAQLMALLKALSDGN